MINPSWAGIHETPSTAIRLVARGTGTLVATVNGQTFTGDTVDTDTNDGLGKVDITGLTPGTYYTIDLTIGEDTEQFYLRTLPESGRIRICWSSCVTANKVGIYASKVLALGADIFISEGDMPYVNDTTSGPWQDVTTDSAQNLPHDTDNYYKLYRRDVSEPGFRRMAKKLMYGRLVDDHEWPGDNWDGTVTQAEAQSPISVGLGHTPSQAEVDACTEAVQPVIDRYNIGNPANDDDGVAAEYPGTYDAGTSESIFTPKYTRFRAGAAMCFMLDCITHRSAIAATDNSSKTMLGSLQKAWFKAQLLAAEQAGIPFKLVFVGKKTYTNSGSDNGDTFRFYTTERDELLQFIKDNDITGVVWLVGDRHTPSIIATYDSEESTTDISGLTKAGVSGDFDHLCICACPAGVQINASPGSVGAQTVALRDQEPAQVIGLVDITEEYLEFRVPFVYMNRDFWRNGRVYAGSNALVYPAVKTS